MSIAHFRTTSRTLSAMPLPEGYVVERGRVSPQEHHDLRVASGLSPLPRPDNEISLANTWFGVVVRKGGKPVAMARIIGDGAFFLTVVDVCTLPEHQRKGLGKAMMAELIRYTDLNAPNAYLTLLADPPGIKLYESQGFVKDVEETSMYRSKYVDRARARSLKF